MTTSRWEEAALLVNTLVSGASIGGLAGAAAGLASVLSKRNDITLRPGTHVDMVLDRGLRFLRFSRRFRCRS